MSDEIEYRKPKKFGGFELYADFPVEVWERNKITNETKLVHKHMITVFLPTSGPTIKFHNNWYPNGEN